MKKIITISISLFALSFGIASASEISGTIGTGNVVISAPVASIKDGTYQTEQSVELTSPGATFIQYTLDGTVPACDKEIRYTGAIKISKSVTVKAIACFTDSDESSISTFDYKIESRRSGGGGGSYMPRVLNNLKPQGEVLGEFTSTEAICKNYLNSMLAYGRRNNIEEVKKLQLFLNREILSTLPITGYFGQLTKLAVIKFQDKYHNEILGIDYKGRGTGNVFSMTLKQINKIECESASSTPAI